MSQQLVLVQPTAGTAPLYTPKPGRKAGHERSVIDTMKESGRRWAMYRGPHGLHTTKSGIIAAQEVHRDVPVSPFKAQDQRHHRRSTLARVRAEIQTHDWQGFRARDFPKIGECEPLESEEPAPSTAKVRFSPTVTIVDVNGTSDDMAIEPIDSPNVALKSALRDHLPESAPNMSFMRISRGTWHIYQHYLYQHALEPLLHTPCYVEDNWCRCLPLVDCYLAGEYLDDATFCNEIMDLYISRVAGTEKRKPCSRVIRDIWQQTDPDSPLRSVVVVLGAAYYDSGVKRDKQWELALPMGYALQMHLLRWREPKLELQLGSAEWRCQFHGHAKGAPRCRSEETVDEGCEIA